jgi:hypothetical protein
MSVWKKMKSTVAKVSNPVSAGKATLSALSNPKAAVSSVSMPSMAAKMPSLPDVGKMLPGPIGDAIGMGSSIAGMPGVKESFQRDPKVTYGTDMATPKMKDYDPSNLQGISTVRGMTAAPGSNPWIGMAKQNQAFNTQQAQNQLGAQQVGAQNQAMSNLAMRGGLRGGAAERMAKTGAQNQMMANQALAGQNISALGNIDTKGEEMRQNMLGQQLGAEQSMSNALNTFNLKEYEEQMKLKGGAMTAQAIENAARAPGLGQTMLNPMYK